MHAVSEKLIIFAYYIIKLRLNTEFEISKTIALCTNQ